MLVLQLQELARSLQQVESSNEQTCDEIEHLREKDDEIEKQLSAMQQSINSVRNNWWHRHQISIIISTINIYTYMKILLLARSQKFSRGTHSFLNPPYTVSKIVFPFYSRVLIDIVTPCIKRKNSLICFKGLFPVLRKTNLYLANTSNT